MASGRRRALKVPLRTGLLLLTLTRPLEGGGPPIRPGCSWLSGVEASDDGEWSTARAQSTAADGTAAVGVDSLARRPGTCQRDEAARLKVDSDSSMRVAVAGRGGRQVAGGGGPRRASAASS